MADTVPTRNALGGATLNRGYNIDVALVPAAAGTPTWLAFMGVNEFKPKFPMGATADTSDFDGGGYKDQDVVTLEWGGEGKLIRKVTGGSATAYDPGQELVRQAAQKLGAAAPILVRIYEYEPGGPRVEAMTGKAVVTAEWDGGGMDAVKSISFTIAGKGAPTSLAHPFPS